MATLERSAQAVWSGDLRGGHGEISTVSGVLQDQDYSFVTRFENQPGTNPEELIAAAHAACFSMAFSGALAKKGYTPDRVITTAFCSLEPKPTGGWRISKMRLETVGWVQGIDEETFRSIAQEAEQGCPVSNLLRNGLEIELNATLGSEGAGLGGAFGG
jgi:osmotically inducible protein OsmC